jgi:hypothetical protein
MCGPQSSHAWEMLLDLLRGKNKNFFFEKLCDTYSEFSGQEVSRQSR